MHRSRGGTVRYTALICEGGHKVTGFAERLSPTPAFCERCGAATMSKCKTCDAQIPGDSPMILGSTPTPSHCHNCGKPYPWREETMARANKMARMQAEIHALDEPTRDELVAFTERVAVGSATADEATTFGQWFRKKAGPEAAKAVGGAFKEIASSVIAAAIQKAMLGP